MFVIIKDREKTIKYDLNVTHTIYYRGIRVYRNNQAYYISLSEGYYFEDQSKIAKLELKTYTINIKEAFYQILLYVYENNKGLDDFDFYVNRNFIIANADQATIRCEDPYLKDKYLMVKEGYIQSNYPIVVNNRLYTNDRLSNGDLVEYLGIRFIYNEEYLYINHFCCQIKLEKYLIRPQKIRYSFKLPERETIFPNKAVKLEIPELNEYEELKKQGDGNLMKMIMPNVVMSLTIMFTALINFYNNLSRNSLLNSITYIISPIGMMLSGIVLPILFNYLENRKFAKKYQENRNAYVSYLQEYETDIKQRINDFIQYNSFRFFNLKNNLRPFYLNDKSEDFLNISIGKMIYPYEFVHKEYNDKIIDEKIYQIGKRLENINDFPLLIDLKDKRIVTIICKREAKKYFINSFLLELAYKHSYEDLNIGIYCSNSRIVDRFYKLPHLFLHNYRLTLTQETQLSELDQKKIKNPLIIIMTQRSEYQFSNPNIHVVYFSNERDDVYRNSEVIVEYLNNIGYLYQEGKTEFSYIEQHYDYDYYYELLSRFNEKAERIIPFTFSNVFEKLDIRKSYLETHRTLKADFAYTGNQLLSFDLHESKQGPHGLIGGTTGSGKSELIVSMLLSLCIRYSPEYLNIVLIDYKGAGICDSLTSERRRLPHIVASVSNLENNAIERLLIALNRECINRQESFRKLSGLTNCSIMNIDDYMNHDPDHFQLRKIAHLLIVVDEFAQLKKEDPEQIRELIAISRIGRSLGIHLILATQRPSGNIDDEIWANSHFKIALKVFDEKDSMDLIKSKEGAFLSEPGSFYLRVNDSLIRAQSIYAKKDISDNEPYEVCLLDEQLNTIKQNKVQKHKTISEANEFVRRINTITDELDLKISEMAFLPRSSSYRSDLKTLDAIVLGESDDYLNDDHSCISFGIDDDILIYSSRNSEINAILNTLNENKRKMIVISSHHYEGRYISDSIRYDDADDIDYMFSYLFTNDNEFTLLIEDLNVFLSYDETYIDRLSQILKRSETAAYSIICLTSFVQLSFKLINSFRNKIMIDIEQTGDLAYFYSSRCNYKGTSFYFDEEIKPFIPIRQETYENESSIFEPMIRRIPEMIKSQNDGDSILLGYNADLKEKVFSDQIITVYSYDQKLLNRYKQAYGERVNTIIYDYSLKQANNTCFIWLGPGLFSQRMVVSSMKYDLKINEGLFVNNGENIMIRSIDYV